MVIKEQIMLTAFDLFSEHGIKNVSMDDIAHNASISKRTLYELFEDKETLLTECINLSYTKFQSKEYPLSSHRKTGTLQAAAWISVPTPMRSVYKVNLRMRIRWTIL